MNAPFCMLLCCLVMQAPVETKKKTAKFKPTRKVVYKEVGDVKLELHIFEPNGHDPKDRRPAIVFFFGGGWNGGNPSQFYPQSDHLAKQGVVAMCAEYRVKSRHKTTPFECVKDGKSAMRYIKVHAAELGVDPDRVCAGGGSAGGHVAAATATVPGLDEDGEDTSISCVPDALILFNPVYDNGPEGWGHDRVGDRYKEISPMHNITEKMPPTIVFLGTKDKLIPVTTAEKFRDKMRAVGVKSELLLFDGRPHGFFNITKGDGSDYRATVKAMDEFLREVGIIRAEKQVPQKMEIP